MITRNIDLFAYTMILAVFLALIVIFYHNFDSDKKYREKLKNGKNNYKKESIFL